MKITHTVPTDRVARIERELRALNARAAKLGVPGYTLEKGTPYAKRITVAHGADRLVEVVDVIVTGERVCLRGWALLARVDHLADEDGNACSVVAKAPGVEADLSAYTHESARCDHCRVARPRLVTYVVEHVETGERKLVGSTCVADFTGYGQSAEAVFALALRVVEIFGEGGGGEGMGGGSDADSLVVVLKLAAWVIRTSGWLPRSKASIENRLATADLVAMALYGSPEKRKDLFRKVGEPTRADLAWAKVTIRWAKRLEPTGDYEANLVACAKAAYVVSRTLGISVSMVAAAQRHYEALRMGARLNKTAYAGTVGKRGMMRVVVVGKQPYEGTYGLGHRVTMIDVETGALVVWWASGDVSELEIGCEVAVKATVKEHGTCRRGKLAGANETVVNRVAVVS